MTLVARVRAIVSLVNRLEGDDLNVPMSVRRSRGARMSEYGAWIVMRRGPDPAKTYDVRVPVAGGEIRVQIMRPHGPGPHPLHVFLHGGGWCVGTLQEREARCRAVSAGAGCVVASVDYRMAPENQYPTPPEDCYAAVCWLHAHAAELDVDASRIAVGGESAGANLAAVVCLMARDRGGPAICHQWLDVPAVDSTLSQSGHREVPDGYMLDAAGIDDYLDHYLADPAQVTEAYCSPLLADDLTCLPPAWIMTCEFDKLRGDGEAYAAALIAAGGTAQHTRLAGHVHPSFAFTRLVPSARAYEEQAIAALREAFAG
jgi:acetyl esterase